MNCKDVIFSLLKIGPIGMVFRVIKLLLKKKYISKLVCSQLIATSNVLFIFAAVSHLAISPALRKEVTLQSG